MRHGFLAILLAVLPCASVAQTDYPAKPVRFIVPTAPGPFDHVARLLTDRLQKSLSQPFVIENAPGGAGTLGMGIIARATPDGYTIGLGLMPATMAEALYPNLPYSVTRDIAPIIQISWGFNILAVHPSLPVNTVGELVAYAKAHPGKLNYASGGNGAPAHIAGALFTRDSGTDMVHIPFKSAPFAVQDVLAGRVQLMFGLAPGLLPHIRSGKLRALAVVGRERLPTLPDVPSMAEAGFPNVAIRDWLGVVAPARTPAAIIERLNRELNVILQTTEVRERLASGNIVVVGGTAENFGKLIAEDAARWSRFIREAGIKLE